MNTKCAGCLGDNPYGRTTSMRNTFCSTGLFRASFSTAKRSDLYLAEGKRVAMCQDGSPECVPYHMSDAEKDSSVKLDCTTADAVMDMCKAR